MKKEQSVVAYDEKSIKHLSGKDAVRAKPQMYIGSTDEQGVFTILREALDNIVDEALSGNCSSGQVFIGEDGMYSVIDDGRGIPVGLMEVKDNVAGKSHKIPAIQAITSLLHTGGKMETSGDAAYAASRGTHGVGIKATNFLSSKFRVRTLSGGKWWVIAFAKGELRKEVSQCEAPVHPATGERLKKGTIVDFVPDPTIFSKLKFPTVLLQEWASLATYFTPGFKFTIHHHSGAKREFHAERGAIQFVEDAMKQNQVDPIMEETFLFTNPLIDCVFQYSTLDGNLMKGFTNGLSNGEGGVHLESFYSALKTAVIGFAKKGQEFTVNELREGLVGLINVKLSAPQFASQTKEKLVDSRAKQPVYDYLVEELTAFLKKNKNFAIRICERCAKLKSLKNSFLKSKRAITEIRRITAKGLPAKAATVMNCSPDKRELILLEGESAAGTSRNARDKSYQEILPLKGKIKNAMRDKKGEALESEEVLNILACIGFDPKAEDPLARLRVCKVICMSDPDPDGYHINALLLSLYQRYIPELFHRGLVYIAEIPEYYAFDTKSKKLYSSDTAEGLAADLEKKGLSRLPIKHIKGYGEVSAEILRYLAFDPATRRLVRIIPSADESADENFRVLMSNDSTARKHLLGI